MTEASIFVAALEKRDPAERAAFLDTVCGADVELRQRVEALLAAHAKADDSLDRMPTVWGQGGTWVGGQPPDPAVEAARFLEPPLRPDSLGRVGHYEVLDSLGRGAFGLVFRAFDDALQRVVALKVLTPEITTAPAARQRFVREARSSARIRHENVVQVYAIEADPIPYLVMEFIPGMTLQALLDQTSPLEVPDVVRIGTQLARGLAAAHAVGVVHRDIKPANILIENGADLRVKITDFGLARAADDASLTQSGMVTGTPMFMSPEQADGRPTDHRADLFSLGSVLYMMCTGRAPFRAESSIAVMRRVVEETPRPIRDLIPEVPVWLCNVISKLHAKDPDDRFQSASEVADTLTNPPTEVPVRQSKPPRPSVPHRSRRTLVIAAGAIALAIAVGVCVFIFTRPEPKPNADLGVAWPAVPVQPVAVVPPTGPAFTNSSGMRFVRVPKGKSWLGGGGGNVGTNEVEFKDDFYLGVYEVTQEEWMSLMEKNPSDYSRTGPKRDDVKDVPDTDLKRFPVDSVTWVECRAFVRRMNEKDPIPGWTYRLPTADEWEYACRGGPIAKEESTFDFYLATPTNDVGGGANLKGAGPNRPFPVGSYPGNRLGLHDMHGNVFELCHDLVGRAGELHIVLRGGGHSDDTEVGHAARRGLGTRTDRYHGSGLRVALVPERRK